MNGSAEPGGHRPSQSDCNPDSFFTEVVLRDSVRERVLFDYLMSIPMRVQTNYAVSISNDHVFFNTTKV
jgi:hypothetical protein